MSLSHRARVIRARDEGVPAFDVLRLLQTNVHSGVLQSSLMSIGIMSVHIRPMVRRHGASSTMSVDMVRDTARQPMATSRCCAASGAPLPVLPVMQDGYQDTSDVGSQ